MAAMVMKEPRHLSGHLQLRHVGVQVETVDALHNEPPRPTPNAPAASP